MSDRTCSIEGCAKQLYARAMCSMHYRRWKDKGDPHRGPEGTPYGAPLAFISQAADSATDECIIWPYADNGNGYGVVYVAGRMLYAHRVVLERTTGVAPAGTYAAHAPLICHNRLCVNPRHLRWATPKENSDDKLIDGLTNRGERHGNSRLTAVQVLAIFRDTRPAAEVGSGYGVSKATVLSIRNGKSWGWLTASSRTAARR